MLGQQTERQRPETSSPKRSAVTSISCCISSLPKCLGKIVARPITWVDCENRSFPERSSLIILKGCRGGNHPPAWDLLIRRFIFMLSWNCVYLSFSSFACRLNDVFAIIANVATYLFSTEQRLWYQRFKALHALSSEYRYASVIGSNAGAQFVSQLKGPLGAFVFRRLCFPCQPLLSPLLAHCFWVNVRPEYTCAHADTVVT